MSLARAKIRIAERHCPGVEWRRKPARKRASFVSARGGTYTGDDGDSTALIPIDTMAGSGSGNVRAGASQPAFPHDDPAATPVRSKIGRASCRERGWGEG